MTTNPTIDESVAARDAWEANAQYWDEFMGSAGNDFVNTLIWPATNRLLSLEADERVLDVACGNGLYSLRIADQGGQVVGVDFSTGLIERARARSAAYGDRILYHVIDATDLQALLGLGEQSFDAAVCNMALFDMANIEPLALGLRRLLSPNGRFVFSVMHPCFNGMHSTFVMETDDDGTQIHSRFFLKLARYMTPFTARGLALRDQPQPQLYFHRPLQVLLDPFLRAGFVLDALEEVSFPPDHQLDKKSSWSGNYSEFPPVLIVRMRLREEAAQT